MRTGGYQINASSGAVVTKWILHSNWQSREVRFVACDQREFVRLGCGSKEGVEDGQRADGHKFAPCGGFRRTKGEQMTGATESAL